jgi:hypothetical protein
MDSAWSPIKVNCIDKYGKTLAFRRQMRGRWYLSYGQRRWRPAAAAAARTHREAAASAPKRAPSGARERVGNPPDSFPGKAE